jgi:hypothetical protein
MSVESPRETQNLPVSKIRLSSCPAGLCVRAGCEAPSACPVAPELVFAQTVAGPPAHHLMERPADLSRQFVLLRELLKVREVALQLVNLQSVAGDQIDQGTEQEIALGAEALHLAFIGYPLIAEDLQNLQDHLEHLPGQVPARFALS